MVIDGVPLQVFRVHVQVRGAMNEFGQHILSF